MKKIVEYITVCESTAPALDITVNSALNIGYKLRGERTTLNIGNVIHYQTMVKYEDDGVISDVSDHRAVKL